MPTDVKFDAVSGDYYPIIYFNDYWNLQKDYYPINESLVSLPLRVSFCPLSLWRWQLYAAQSTKSPWNFLGDELYEQSDEEQDSVKVRQGRGFPAPAQAAVGAGGYQTCSLGTSGLCLLAPSFTTSQTPPCSRQEMLRVPPALLTLGSCLRSLCRPPCHSSPVGLWGLRVWTISPPLGSDSMSLLPLTMSLTSSQCLHLSLGLCL